MKSLTLLRHAEAANGAACDFDRPLTPHGRQAARAVGRLLRDRDVVFDWVVASPALRVEQTIAEVAAGAGRALDPMRDRRLYLAAPATMLDVLRETPPGCERVLLVGHNGGLEELALVLAGDAGALAGRRYPTAGLAEFGCAIAHWADLRPGSTRLLRFTDPADLVLDRPR